MSLDLAVAELELRRRREAEAEADRYDWFGPNGKARDKQRPPDRDWFTWLILAGRGFGKTRTGAEWVRHKIEAGQCKRMALVAPTAADARDVMVEGESGILAISPPGNRPVYEPSKRRLTWPSGAIATLYSADEPDRLRGPQHDGAWCDEIAAWRYPDAWDQLLFGLRLGQSPQICATTTPRPIPLVKSLLKDPKVAVTRGSTYENSANLAKTTLDELRNKYEGTRLGRQELNAEVLEDVEGALWSLDLIDANRVSVAPEMTRIAVAIDPSGGDTEGHDEQGIVVCGKGKDGLGYVLGDYSVRETPNGWARAAVNAYLATQADVIVYEANYGGAMVLSTLQNAADAMTKEGLPTGNIRFQKVTAMRGKQLRAEPVVALYEQGRIKHVGGLPGLEQQMTHWVPDIGDSPDRVDAMVWAITALDIRHASRYSFGTPEPAATPDAAKADDWNRIDNEAFWGDA